MDFLDLFSDLVLYGSRRLWAVLGVIVVLALAGMLLLGAIFHVF